MVSLPLPAAARMAAQLPAPAKNCPLPAAEKRPLTKRERCVRLGASGSVSLNLHLAETRRRVSTKKSRGLFSCPGKDAKMQRKNRKNGHGRSGMTGGRPQGPGRSWERETLLLVIDMLGQVQLNLVEQGVACETLQGWNAESIEALRTARQAMLEVYGRLGPKGGAHHG